ncbi:hypothetical protein [Paracoccus aminophilus]|uniref:Quinohemoprotein amine dehydrogenase A, alpha subunit n=1 Tax=Paracoccus aminophilus JCM 7686 TaxID=1367847 RepID=S5YBQ8_PARAH|nr:hypothetical protein [Paracoccus aminophilus]AGT08888.1 quinohemoprotein amine dehydrogenase A, alpha subunit [Paracoccus aminophilus JCM 7686]
MKALTTATLLVAALCGGPALAQDKTAGKEPTMSESYGIERDTPLAAKIADFTATGPKGARLELAKLTDFDWDKVVGFHGPYPREIYQRILGSTDWLTPERAQAMTDESVMLVFLDHGQVVAAPVISPPIWLIGVEPVVRGREAALVVTTPDPGPYAHLKLE